MKVFHQYQAAQALLCQMIIRILMQIEMLGLVRTVICNGTYTIRAYQVAQSYVLW